MVRDYPGREYIETVESIPCDFKIIQSPDLEHLIITIRAIQESTHLDNFALSFRLHPNLSVEKAKALENALNECVKALWVNIKEPKPKTREVV